MSKSKKLFVVLNGDSASLSVIRDDPIIDDVDYESGDRVLCEISLSKRAQDAYNAFEVLRRVFGNDADSPLYYLLDEVASAVYIAMKEQ